MQIKVSNQMATQTKKCLAYASDPPIIKNEVIKKLAFDFCNLDEAKIRPFAVKEEETPPNCKSKDRGAIAQLEPACR